MVFFKNYNHRENLRECVIRKLLITVSAICLFFSCAAPFGIYHKIKKGETLYGISVLYKTDVDKLKEINNIADETKLKEGDYVFVPDVKGPATGSAAVSIDPAHSKEKNKGSDKTVTRIESSEKSSQKAQPSKFVWPAKGVVTSTFGNRWGNKHEGIDIGCPEGTQVFAAAAGKVIFSGDRGGYGNVIIIQHGNDWFTIYAHNSKNSVSLGADVKQGDYIALSGKTGRATGPHLHFEVRQGVKPVDPLEYLPTVP